MAFITKRELSRKAGFVNFLVNTFLAFPVAPYIGRFCRIRNKRWRYCLVTTSMLKGGRTVSRYTWRFAITEFCHFLLLRYRLSLSILKKESFSLAEMLASRIPGYFICKWRTGRETSSMETDKWESIQYYGNYLEKTAHTLQYTDIHMEPASVQSITIPKKRTLDSPFLFEWFSWRNFRFDTEFAQLAPLITREIRLYAPQAAKLSDWILDWGNDVFFGWQGLGQVVGPPPPTEETRRQREIIEHTALVQEIPYNRSWIEHRNEHKVHLHAISRKKRRSSLR
jgi:hypothetical protein